MRYILAIDPGSITTGYAYQDGSSIESGVIDINPKTKIWQRLQLIRSHLAGIIQAQETPIFTKAVIEIPVAHDYARNVGRKGRQVTTGPIMIMSRALGVIQECCCHHCLDVVEVSATLWTKGIPKRYRCDLAAQIADRHIADDNEADAICLLDWYTRRNS